MAMDLLQQFLGNDRQRQDDYDDFVQRFQHNPDSISDEEAARRYRELLRHAPPEAQEEANEYAFSQMDPQERRRMAQGFRRVHDDPSNPFQGYAFDNEEEAASPRNLGRMMKHADEQAPDLLGQLLGGGRGRSVGRQGQEPELGALLSSPMGKMAMAAGAAYLANRFLNGQGRGVSGGLGSVRKGRGGLF